MLPAMDVKNVLAYDAEVCEAIDRAQEGVAEFLSVIRSARYRQSGFMVTIFNEADHRLEPLGIEIQHVEHDRFHGYTVQNQRGQNSGDWISCGLSDVVDWRYIDTWECEGAMLYRCLLSRRPPLVQKSLLEQLPCLLVRETIVDSEFRDFMRDIAGRRYADVANRLDTNPELIHRSGDVPFPISMTGCRVILKPCTPWLYAVRFGDEIMLQLLLARSAGIELPKSLLISSAIAGNIETTMFLLDRQFDPNFHDNFGHTALAMSAKYCQVATARLLLERGADCELRDVRNRSAIYYANDVSTCELIVDAGARLDVVDDEGRTCVEWHVENGNCDVASYLISKGAPAPDEWEQGYSHTESVERGTQQLLAHIRRDSPAEASDWTEAFSLDYGYVLPTRWIDIDSGRGVCGH